MNLVSLLFYAAALTFIACLFVSLGAAVAWAFIHVVEWVTRRVGK